jgi:hypothetical protein
MASGSRAAVSQQRARVGRGVVIAHRVASVRMGVAMELIDEHPVCLASGVKGMLYHLELAARGAARAPCAMVVGEPELRQLVESAIWWRLAGTPVRVILLTRRAVREVEGADAVLCCPPEAAELRACVADL